MSQTGVRNTVGSAPVTGITCEEVIRYQKMLLSNEIVPDNIQSAVATHTAVCPACRKAWTKGTKKEDEALKDAKPN
ncbi:MAG: hypothetical protein WAX66_02315 [Patescibacteria group bacterium]